jgi:hypothetical protein
MSLSAIFHCSLFSEAYHSRAAPALPLPAYSAFFSQALGVEPQTLPV